MTIDFIKVKIVDKSLIEKIKSNHLLVWYTKTEKLSHFDFEEVQTKETKTFKGILFCFYSNRLEILFRPHYYFNDNEHNANDFPVKDCIMVLQEFIDVLEIKDFEPYKIVNIEYGLNLVVKVPIENLITFIGYHGKNEFKTDAGLTFSKKSYTSNRNGTVNTYKIIKAYAKGLQFPEHTSKDTFRFEVKSKKSRYINKLGIYDISDILNPSIYDSLGIELIKEFSEVLILDNDSTFGNLKPKEKTSLRDYLNTHTWYKILQNKKSRNNFSYHKKRYFHLLDKTGFNIHIELKNLISNKIDLLKVSAYSPPKKRKEISAHSPIYIGGICTKNHTEDKKVCPVTGLDISMQKKNSSLLSNTGLRHLEKTDLKQFVFIKNQLLTGCPNKFEKDIYSQISKQIRNRYYSNSNNCQGPTLF